MKMLVPEDRTTDEAGFYRGLEVDILARTIWGEARGEGPQGMQAVSCVIMNRVRRGGWWGNDIVKVCQKPYQFSCWNKTDPNFQKLLNVSESDIHFATAMRIARRAIYARLPDMTGGATHYHAASIMPVWAKGQEPSAVIGRHVFYDLQESQ